MVNTTINTDVIDDVASIISKYLEEELKKAKADIYV